MSIPAAFTGVILIWSTTPLAIQWSSEGGGFLFAVTARMVLGLIFCLVTIRIAGIDMPWHARARGAYLAAGIAIYGAMTLVYWGAQYVSSGLIAVLYGLTPIFTGVLAALWLNERGLTTNKIFGIALGIAGLIVIFGNGIEFGNNAVKGILGVVLSVILHSISAVWVKAIGAKLPAIDVTHGGLLIAAPLYLITWFSYDGTMPQDISTKGLLLLALSAL